jgi:cupin fold WbuC family metalloprotein
MRITILGGGYVGMALARHWRGDPSLQVTITSTREERRPELELLADHVAILRGDDATTLKAVLSDSEALVLCLAPTANQQVDAATYAKTYTDTFLALQKLLVELPQLRQIVYTGSCSVYGNAEGGWVDESTPANPRDAQGQVLLEAEQLLLACSSPERRVCVLRLGAIYGPGRELAARLRRLAGSTRAGSGAQHSNWIHRDDVVGAISTAVHCGWQGLVNVVDDQPLPLAELLQRVCEAAGYAPVQWDPTVPVDTAVVDRRIRNARLQELGYALRHPHLQIPALKRIDQSLFDQVAAQALQAPRLRRNHNLHAEPEAVQRFLNVLQPGTYVRPHRHLRLPPGAGFECFLVLQGAIGLLLLDAQGEVIQQERLEASGPLRGVELGEGQFHTLVALTPDAVMFELKQGPYQPTSDKDFLAFFPVEGTPEAAAQERRWRALFTP